MTAYPSQFFLKVIQVEQSCWFELTWGTDGQRIMKVIPFPTRLSHLYTEWQRLYLGVYRTLDQTLAPILDVDDGLRGRSVASGVVQPTSTDLKGQLQTAEASLLHEFRRWLLDPELHDIRAQLAAASQAVAQSDRPIIDLFLTCSPLDLARFPWETWQITAEFAIGGQVRLVRTSENIRQPTTQPEKRKARVLAVIGGDALLNFEKDKAQIQSLTQLAEVVCVGWRPGQSNEAVIDSIKTAIADPQGWDILFFAGHSNETPLTGGELGIAPHLSMQVQEILPQLQAARSRGLQFALFNSCSGLSIADALIDRAGLGHVAIMREPIHHRVAYEFLVQFLKALTRYKSVHESVSLACQYLQLEKQSIYPSSYFVPSLFRHPRSSDFCLVRSRLRNFVQRLTPTRHEAIALAVLCALSWPLSVQQALLDQRVGVQAQYRQITNQVPVQEPSLLLVQLDDQSLSEAGRPNPLTNREYLARLVDQAIAMGSDTIALDYVLDSPQGEQDAALARAFAAAREADITLILGTTPNERGLWRSPLATLAAPDTYWQGNLKTYGDGRYFSFPPLLESDSQKYRFAYLIALAQRLHQSDRPDLSELSLNDIAQTYLPPSAQQPLKLTQASYLLRQGWMYPIVDFSIPPDSVYAWIPAWEFLELTPAELQERYGQRSVMIMPGHSDAGINFVGEDVVSEPPATRFWRQRSSNERDRRRSLMQGGEIHAYLSYHFGNQRPIVPLPDVWMVLVAALVAKGMMTVLQRQEQRDRTRTLAIVGGGNVVYGVISLQAYVGAGILLPILWPTITLWSYLAVYLRNKQR